MLVRSCVVLGVLATGCSAAANAAPSTGTSRPATITINQFADESQVVAAVIRGESVNKLPKSAVPQLETLSAGGGIGMSAAVSAICNPPTTTESSVYVPGCTFGDIHSSRTIVLVGDSRAQMWSDVFIQIAAAAHVKLVLLAKTACPAALGTFRLTNPQGYPSDSPWPACTAWHKFVLSTIKKLAPQVVVVSSTDHLFLMSAPGYAGPPQVKSAVSAFLKALPVGAKRVEIDGFPDPGNTISPTLCLSKNPSSVEKCAYRPTAYPLAYNAAVQQAAEQNGAAFINEATWLCAAKCPAVIAGILPYTTDGFHIQAEYATYLTGVMWASLKPYLG
jgi:hypothetical protein